MKDLNRLLDDPGTDPLSADLLRLARNEGPSGESRRRILAGLGMGVAAATLTQTSGAAQTAVGSAASSAALKWGVASVIAVGASVLAFMSLRPQAPTAVVPPATVAAAPAAPPVAPIAPGIDNRELVPVTKLEDLPTLAGSNDTDAKSVSAPSLAEEVAAIKSAKAALASGNAGQSLRELDNYRARFPRGRLAQEAAVVRIEALLKSGNSAAANAAADRFLSANASSPYAARVHTLIGR
jgi:hypothetical protein